MKPNIKFKNQPKKFWAYVRTISEAVGYTERGTRRIKIPTVSNMKNAFRSANLDPTLIANEEDQPTLIASTLLEYFKFRADTLNDFVEPRLMDAARAKSVYERLHKELSPRCPIPMNKQKGDKRAPAYLTAITNMLIEANAEGLPCDYDPRKLTTLTTNGEPLRTLARRVDGALPGTINPVAIWEIKEYYYTTTFGSRVADGVYETLLDGMELEEAHEHEGIDIMHLLIIDAHYTWWDCGRSYLCRIIDMLHMGYVDEVLFGYEVVERLPDIVKELVKKVRT